MRRRRLLAVALMLVIGACSSGGDDSTGTTTPADAVTSTTEAQTTPPPTGLPLVDSLPLLEVLGPPEADAGAVPNFRWTAVEGAAGYTIGVMGPDGPLWAWQGEETGVYLGGLPFERPPGLAGPTLTEGACWSVIASDASGAVIAASAYLPLNPGGSDGHTCVPGTGVQG